jgi:hypothetical protein
MGRKNLLDLSAIAAKLDADERLKLTYRLPISSSDGSVVYETRTARLLDVSEESGLLYVRQEGEVIWVKIDEAVEVTPDAAAPSGDQ